MTYGPVNGIMGELTYDCRNRLVSAGGVRYTYDAENNRISAETDGYLEEYVTDDNGLYYMRQRYYNTEIKRFINQDVVRGSLTNSQSLNRYSYVQGT